MVEKAGGKVDETGIVTIDDDNIHVRTSMVSCIFK